jgi:hypothetical protein
LSTSVQQRSSDFCCWSKSRREARIAQTTLMTDFVEEVGA